MLNVVLLITCQQKNSNLMTSVVSQQREMCFSHKLIKVFIASEVFSVSSHMQRKLPHAFTATILSAYC